MSIKTKISNFNIEIRKKIAKDLDLVIYPKKKFGGGFGGSAQKPKNIQPFLVRYDEIYLPFSYGMQLGNNNKIDFRPNRENIMQFKSPIKFTGQLRPHQKQVKDEAISLLNSTSSVILSVYPGYGKTCMAIYMASKIGFKTCIVVHKLVLIDQWKESIEKFCPDSKVQVLSAKSERDMEADFYIINAINTEKLSFDFFKGIGLLIVDELHTIVSDVLSKCFFHIQPRFLIGLSATPYRSDGLDILIDLIFGKNKIIRELTREHIVYKVDTGFVPDAKIDMSGKLIWNSVLESQSESVERNQIILDIVKKFKDRYFLILCKRVSQANYLYSKLEEMKEDVTSLVGSNKVFNKESRILIATVQKAGVGFSHDILNTLIIASDMEEYFVQYLGRVIRTEEGVPLVFDLVDEHPTLKRHFNTRKKIYTEAGGKIKNYKLDE